jgi:curli production assembly/transport component CsgF
MKAITVRLAIVAASVGFATAASASQLSWTFVNPTFGGSGLNGTYLLGTAQGQGFGAKSGQAAAQQPDLTGLTNAINNLGTTTSSVVANPTGTTTTVPSSP